MVLEKTLESPLDCKEIQPVHSKGDQSWVFFGRNDVKAETPILWPSHAKSWLFGKESDALRDWGQEEKGTTEDEMAGWHHQLDAHEFGWTLVVGYGQGGLACCNSWGRKELDTTEQLNWTEWKIVSELLRFVCADPIETWFLSQVMFGVFSLSSKYGRRGGVGGDFLIKENMHPTLGRTGKRYLLFLNCLQPKIINMPKCHIWGWHSLMLFKCM